MSNVGPHARHRTRGRRAGAAVAFLASSIAAMGACASVGSSNFEQGTNGSASSSGQSGVVVSFGDGGGTTALLGGDGASVSGDGGNEQVCNDGSCTCIRIASIGHEGIWGACGMYGDGTAAFENWLSTQSTATVDSFSASKPTLTADFLKTYDVIVLQWLRDVSDAGSDGALWQFSQDEIDALAAWVQNGGGLITLSGYDGDGQETVPLNQLLSFTDFEYNTDGTYGSDCNGCWGGACALENWNPASPISAHITKVGMQFGRSISVAADAGNAPVVDAPCPGGNDCAVHEDIGKGHVFAFTDEWPTYTSQWLGQATCIAASCAGSTPADDFQVPQFWYNAIKYASSAAQCFVIQNPTIVR
jgi:hypothetical protein